MSSAFASNQAFIGFDEPEHDEAPPEHPRRPPPPPPPPSSSSRHQAAEPSAAASAPAGSRRPSKRPRDTAADDDDRADRLRLGLPGSGGRPAARRREEEEEEEGADEAGGGGGGGGGERGPPYRSSTLKEERRAASRSTPWVDEVDWSACRNPAEMLNREILSFVAYISPSPTEHATRSHIVDLIRQAVGGQWRDATVSPFGSFETGLYLPTGDIDLVIESASMDRQNKVSVLHTLAAVLRRANLAENIQVIAKAKVPIVKFISSYGRLPVDISINQSNGISAGKIVNAYLSSLPALKPLVLVVKAFLSQRGMNEVYSGGLGSYSVICLVISFLQLHPKVRRAEVDPASNLGVLLIEFFELYGKNFGYDDTGISLREGGYYYSKEARGWHNERQRYLLSIEDPQDDSNDISRGSHGILRVKSTFSGAYEVLTSRLYIRAESIARRRVAGVGAGAAEGRHTRYGEQKQQQPHEGSEMSILVGIMGVTPEVLAQRRTLKDLYDSGRLQDRLGIARDAALPAASLPSSAQQGGGVSRPPTTTTMTTMTAMGPRATGGKGREQTKLSAIHVESSPERSSGRGRGRGQGRGRSLSSSGSDDDDRRRRQRGGGDGSDDDDEESDEDAERRRRRPRPRTRSPDDFDFVDQPFRPAAATTARSATQQPSTSANASARSKGRRSAAADDDDDDDDDEADSRYAVGQPSAGKKRRKAPAGVDAFSAAPAGRKGNDRKRRPASTPEEGEISRSASSSVSSSSVDSSSSSSEASDLYIDGQEELLPTSDESDFEERERRFRQAKKNERRKARQTKRAYWSAKGGDAMMDSSLRYGGLLSD